MRAEYADSKAPGANRHCPTDSEYENASNQSSSASTSVGTRKLHSWCLATRRVTPKAIVLSSATATILINMSNPVSVRDLAFDLALDLAVPRALARAR